MKFVLKCVVFAACAAGAVAAKVDVPPRLGGELRFAIRGEPKNFDPHVVVWTSHLLWSNI